MADFCGACARDGMPGNDLLGWLDGSTGYRWALCEGCGFHRFDDAGERACVSGGCPGLGESCPQCLATDAPEDAEGALPYLRVELS